MILTAILTIISPLLVLIIPGIAWLPQWYRDNPLLLWARIAIVSLTLTTLSSLAAALIGFPQMAVMVILIVISTIALITQRKRLIMITAWHDIVAPPVGFALLLLLFSLPWLYIHDGLPTGDIQKSLVWSEEIPRMNRLPSYQRARADYNRDPVDFFTPGLHTTLAYVQSLSNSPATASMFAIVVAIAVAGMAAALAQQLFPSSMWWLSWLAAALVLTNFRFLRYLREPGYHVQNSLGELLLFGVILLVVLLLKRWTWTNALLVAAGLLALAFTHQFSMFIAAFALLPFAAMFVIQFYRHPRSPAFVILPLISLVSIALLGFWLGLHEKIGHIFSASPHLLDETPTLFEYFSLMGPAWFALGLAGLLLLVVQALQHRKISGAAIAFAGTTLIILVLSQAPRLFIDIPPVRALFYSIVPLSILGSYTISQVKRSATLLIIMVLIAASTSLGSAFTLSHGVRTNSTLLPEHIYLIDVLTSEMDTGGVLIDDYNRRSASWLILAQRPMYTRIAADLARQMAESDQSRLRHQLYLNQLDYEKIFSLGSHPAMVALLNKHSISWVTGIEGSSRDSFAHNPTLIVRASGGDIHMYQIQEERTDMPSCEAGIKNIESRITPWLLRASTLVNDIGDREDTFQHLPASIRAARLSNPQFKSACTYRTTDARFIPLHFNVGDYVAALWQQDQTEHPDIALEVVVQFATPPTQQLTLRTSSGAVYDVPRDGFPLTLPARDTTVNEDGFIILTLENASGEFVSIDLIALGLSHIP